MADGHSNFAFLQTEWPELHAESLRAEHALARDPRAACFYARRTLELTVAWLFRADPSLKMPYKADLPDGHPNSPTRGHLKLLHLN